VASHGQIDQLLRDPRIWQAGRSSAAACAAITTGWLPLDRALGGGWPLGQLTELLMDLNGVGELTLLLPALARLTRQQGAPAGWGALIAPPYIPYAPALRRAGVDLSKLLVVHARQDMDTLWAMEQALHSRTCAVVVGWSQAADDASLRRLQLAAEASGSWVVLFRPSHLRSTRSPAPLRIHLVRHQDGDRLSLHITKRRGGPPAMAGVDVGR
jgi:protein ImuA